MANIFEEQVSFNSPNGYHMIISVFDYGTEFVETRYDVQIAYFTIEPDGYCFVDTFDEYFAEDEYEEAHKYYMLQWEWFSSELCTEF